MDGLMESDPPLSRACCVSPDLYCPIGKFQVVGRIWKPEFNVPIIAGHGPSHPLTSTDQGCCHQPQAIPVRGLVSSAEATRTRALTTGRPRHMCRESDALPTELRDGLSFVENDDDKIFIHAFDSIQNNSIQVNSKIVMSDRATKLFKTQAVLASR